MHFFLFFIIQRKKERKEEEPISRVEHHQRVFNRIHPIHNHNVLSMKIRQGEGCNRREIAFSVARIMKRLK